MVLSEMADVRDFRCFGMNKIISLFRDHCDHRAIDQAILLFLFNRELNYFVLRCAEQ